MGSEESEGEGGAGSVTPRPLDSSPSSTRKKKDLTSEQKNKARAAQLRQIETEFFKFVETKKAAAFLDIDFETTEAIFYYWKLKRRVSFVRLVSSNNIIGSFYPLFLVICFL